MKEFISQLGIDGNWVDTLTFSVAVSVAFLLVGVKTAKKIPITRISIINDFFNATVIVPFGMLAGSIFWKGLLDELFKGANLSLALASMVALTFVITELFNFKSTGNS